MSSPGARRSTVAVGRSVPRLESTEKVTGRGRYTADLELPRMAHARLVRSPHAHARVLSVDDSAALALPGVVLVLSSANIAAQLPGLPAFSVLEGRPPGTAEEHGDCRLFDAEVRYAGEPVAVVVAETDALAREAAALIEVEYDVLPAVLDPEAAQGPEAPPVHADAPGNRSRRMETRRGDVDAALAGAALVLERRFATPRQKQAQLEPTVCVAELDGSRKLTVWSPHQSPHRLREALASVFGLPQPRVRVVTPLVGGAFGKSDALTAEPYAAALTLITGRPIKLRYSRQEDFIGTDARHPTITDLTIGFRADGTIAALRARSLVDAGAYLGHSVGIVAVVARQLLAPYRIEHAEVEVQAVYTHTPPTGAFRGYGGPQAAFPVEHLIDLAARELGIDPLEARLRMRTRAGDDWRGLGPIVSDGFGECLERGAAAIGWHTSRAAGPDRAGRLRRGVGMACTVWGSGAAGRAGIFDYSGAVARVNTDGTVTLATGGCDLGTGLRTALAQICADELGVPIESTFLTEADTDQTPFDSGAHASRSLYRNGQAVQQAACEVRRQVLEYAATKLEAAVGDLDLSDGRVTVRGAAERSISLAALASQALRDDRELVGAGGTQSANAPTFVAQFAEVEVDVETGQVRLLRLVTAQDVGRAINPAVAIGQIQGAAHQGIGYALSETLIVDPETGNVLNGTYMEYRLPTSLDAPTSEVILVECPDPSGPFGAKGIAELGVIPTAPAIANAILHATGAGLTELPMSPERVLAAIRRVDGAAS
jgi:xanthine dehydrogenase molybdenum-binding subunit